MDCSVRGSFTVSGDIHRSWDTEGDLRLLLSIRGVDALRSIEEVLSEDRRAEYHRLLSGYRVSRYTLEQSRSDWRLFGPEDIFPSHVIRDMREALLLAAEDTSHTWPIGQVAQRLAVRDLFSAAEWEGFEVDVDAPDVSPRFRDMLLRHTFGRRVHPQIDVVPASVTGRLGVRGGLNVMAWERGSRRSLRAGKGRLIRSIDFVAMDLTSLSLLSDDVRSLIDGHADPYVALVRGLFDGCAYEDTMRKVVKGSFLQMAYGASDHAIESSLGIGASGVGLLRDAYRPILGKLAVGPELARIVQSTSSNMFYSALASISGVVTQTSHRALFPVHDELILEGSADDRGGITRIAAGMEASTLAQNGLVRYKTRIREGLTYEELEELV